MSQLFLVEAELFQGMAVSYFDQFITWFWIQWAESLHRRSKVQAGFTFIMVSQVGTAQGGGAVHNINNAGNVVLVAGQGKEASSQ